MSVQAFIADMTRLAESLRSVADWDALPAERVGRFELVDGLPRGTPIPGVGHRLVAQELAVALDRALRPTWRAVTSVEVTIAGSEPATVRAPDVVVLRPGAVDLGTETVADRSRHDPADVLAVAEVTWPGSEGTDRFSKPADYAEVGIGCYLIVEPGPPTTMTELRLRGDAYERVAEHSGTANLTLDGSDVVVDLAGMLEP